jgi:hypothetical protein
VLNFNKISLGFKGDLFFSFEKSVLNFTKFPLGFKEDLFSLFVEGIYEKSMC